MKLMNKLMYKNGKLKWRSQKQISFAIFVAVDWLINWLIDWLFNVKFKKIIEYLHDYNSYAGNN